MTFDLQKIIKIPSYVFAILIKKMVASDNYVHFIMYI